MSKYGLRFSHLSLNDNDVFDDLSKDEKCELFLDKMYIPDDKRRANSISLYYWTFAFSFTSGYRMVEKVLKDLRSHKKISGFRYIHINVEEEDDLGECIHPGSIRKLYDVKIGIKKYNKKDLTCHQ